ncbi:glycosyltransferase family 87 protein [Legionella bononiensis]|uniref:DUF2029 domain-containing protein n=1 Tax=Legionella bononiensis TaxID=2793102 RepID=A0ABS1W8W5_9GAMM|nr:glycosyltransferase family 87 protein [Legionella bononiensis]MBL7479685.1 DUF2029 domain-containing protein [Legionella bononiensis]MBL7525803.1 DUF2029 domain-containing protein [Legionella bononiensis]MBL7561985.1 DUF2029 domain-containing protein [Legionella bononiensis]
MNKRIWQPISAIWVLITYTLLFYLVFNDKFKLDFTTFYSSIQALMHDDNPYATLVADYLPIPRKLSGNLCPPVFLVLTYPLGLLNYHTALLCWFLISFISGLIGAGITFSLAFSKDSLHQYGLILVLLYMMLFSTIMNLVIGQIGSILFLFIMLGYYYYLRERDYLAGILWALIISIKFFPGLLFFYVLAERRFKLFFTMLFICLCCWAIPLYLCGPQIYQHYYNLMSNVTWYADSWNASIYGFLFRLFTFNFNVPHELRLKISLIYLIVFTIAFGFYYHFLRKITNDSTNHPVDHYRFCLTLVFMLLLSPFGWIYYFSLLILPLLLCWSKEVQKLNAPTRTLGFWLLCLFLLNFPFDYVKFGYMPNFLTRTTIYSFHFYGLLSLAYLIIKEKALPGQNELIAPPLLTSLIIILMLGSAIPLVSFIVTLIYY